MISVIGRSIGLHDGLPLFDCAEVHRVYISDKEISLRTDEGKMTRYVVHKVIIPCNNFVEACEDRSILISRH